MVNNGYLKQKTIFISLKNLNVSFIGRCNTGRSSVFLLHSGDALLRNFLSTLFNDFVSFRECMRKTIEIEEEKKHARKAMQSALKRWLCDNCPVRKTNEVRIFPDCARNLFLAKEKNVQWRNLHRFEVYDPSHPIPSYSPIRKWKRTTFHLFRRLYFGRRPVFPGVLCS